VAELLEYLIRVRGGAQGKREADQAAEGFDNLAGAATRAKVASAGTVPSVNQLSGRLQILGAAAVFAGPSLIALGSSAGAAAAGGAAVAGGGVAALTVGLAGFVGVAAQAKSNAKAVKTAFDAAALATQQYGKGSDQARTANEKLNAVVAQNGGPQVLKAIRGVNALGKSWTGLTRVARGNVFGTVNDGIAAARRLLPGFAKDTNRNSGVIRTALGHAFDALSGREMQQRLAVFSNVFRRIAGPLVRGFVDGFMAVGRILQSTGPYVIRVAAGFERVAHSWRVSTSDGRGLSNTMQMLVGHTRAWWGLAKALGGLLVSVFRGSQGEGKRLVDTLTNGVRRLAAWVDAGRKTGALQGMFKRFGDAFVAVAKAAVPVAAVIGILANALIPALTSGAGGLQGVLGLWALQMKAVAAVLQFLGPLAGPLVTVLVAWKIATTQLAIANGVLNAILALNPVVAIVVGIVALIAILVLAYQKVAWFRTGVQALWTLFKLTPTGFVISHLGQIVSFVTTLPGKLAKAGSGMWDWLKNAFRDAINFVLRGWNSLHFRIPEINTHIPGVGKVGGGEVGVTPVPLLASGGRVRASGSAIVGDRGPELLTLPGGARVDPLPAGGGHPTSGRDIVLNVDGHAFGRITARQIAESQARG
jgi:hypothetical protein